MSSLALPAYLASAASTASLQNTIPEEATSSEDETFATYFSKWQGILGAALPPDSLPAKQSFWDTPGITQVIQAVEESKLDAFQRAQFLAASAPYSGDWLLALLIASCGLKLDDEAICVAERLCIPFLRRHWLQDK